MSKKSERDIRNAYLELRKEYPFEKIKVSELCDLAMEHATNLHANEICIVYNQRMSELVNQLEIRMKEADMELICAEENTYEAVRDFYYRLTDEMQGAEFKPGWEKDVYPTQEFLKESIQKKELYYTMDQSEIQACMIVNHNYNEGYKDVEWSIEASDEEILVIHALGVLPQYSGKGIAKELVQKVIHRAKLQNIKTIRLDVLEGNLPAEKAYTKSGFRYVTTLKMYYEDTGRTNYKVFEYIV